MKKVADKYKKTNNSIELIIIKKLIRSTSNNFALGGLIRRNFHKVIAKMDCCNNFKLGKIIRNQYSN